MTRPADDDPYAVSDRCIFDDPRVLLLFGLRGGLAPWLSFWHRRRCGYCRGVFCRVERSRRGLPR